MAITKQHKEELVSNYVNWLDKSEALIVTEYIGLNMKDIDTLRGKIRESGGEFHIVKNTLGKVAFEQAGLEIPENYLIGSTAIAFAFEDGPATAKALTDFAKDSDFVKELLETLKEKERYGYEYEAAEASFDILIRKCLGKFMSLFELNNYHLESYKTGEIRSKTVGRIFLSHNGKQIMGAGVGTGPVETLDRALRDALTPFQPFLKSIHLIDYRVRVLNPEAATASKVRVFTTSTDNTRTWDTVGVSENIIEASWEALIDSFDYYYNNYVLENDEDKTPTA